MPVILLLIFFGILLFGSLEHKSDMNALAFYFVCAVLVGTFAVSDGIPIIDGKYLSRIGVLSYGIYLIHMPVISAVNKVTIEPMLVMFLTLLVVVPLAWLSFSYFEEPIRQWGKRAKPYPRRRVSICSLT
jgi:peptidoglycan/LPS O-acetylase OafA/YrhL